MNHSVLDWNMEEDRNQKKFIGPDNELMEILWRNGHVVMHSQTHRKPLPFTSESKLGQKPEHGVAFKNSIDLIQETDMAPWFQYPIDDSLEREFCSELFCQMPGGDETGDKVVAIEGDKSAASMLSNLCYEENMMPPPPPPPPPPAPCLENGGIMNPSLFSKKKRVDSGLSNRELGQRGKSSSKLAIGSSACGSNQVQDRIDESRTFSNNMTGGSGGSSFGRVGVERASNSSHKRKRRGGEESESHSEEADYESFDIENRQAKRSASARRTRASEVHNLSERRRRDRINEKMKALQELIPHCTKSDKASMLDEAIEYLKSLQLQVQIMWMGGGMAPVLYPGVQRYMSAIGAGMVHSSMPLTRSPLVAHPLSLPPNTNRTMIHPSAPLNSMDFQTQMPNIHLLEPYAGYLGFNRLPQAMNFFPYGSRAEQQNRAFGDNSGIGGISSDKTQNGQSAG